MRNSALRRQLKQLLSAEEGQVIVLTTWSMAVLMLMAGWGVEAGLLRYKKEQMQKAADAGAIAGASTMMYGGNYTQAAHNDAAANGFTAGTNGTTVTVNSPPQSGPYNGVANYVEVIVSQPQPTLFMKLIGSGSKQVSARAVASAAGSSSGCVYVLDPIDKDSYLQSGSASVTSACGIFVNSSNSSGFDDNNSSTCTTAPYIGVVGGDNHGMGCFPKAHPQTGITPVSDPLANLAKPSSPTCSSWHTVNINKTMAISQGVYCGGISISGGTVTLNPGTYIINGGGFTVNGGNTAVKGTGVTIYDTGSVSGSGGYRGIKITGGANAQLSAPTSGALAGILFFEDRSVPLSVGLAQTSQVTGGSNSYFTGIMYFPTTQLIYSGGSSLVSAPYTGIVAYKLEVSGPSTLNNDTSSLAGGSSPIHSAAMAE